MRLLLFLFISLSSIGWTQVNLKDEPINTLLIGLNYKGNVTGGDLALKWGFTNHLGLDVNYKFANNLTVGLDGGFLFGNQLRDASNLQNLFNSSGEITAFAGGPAEILYLMRGATGYADIGYVFNQFGNNPNSGIWIKLGVGYMMHKMRIENLYDDVFQLEGDYKKGYDELSMGVSSKQFIGYLYQANRRLVKFYAGFEFIQGITRNVRTYNFSTGGPDNTLKTDFLYGFKVGYIIPIYKRSRLEYYYD
jgi:hypothetical protein